MGTLVEIPWDEFRELIHNAQDGFRNYITLGTMSLKDEFEMRNYLSRDLLKLFEAKQDPVDLTDAVHHLQCIVQRLSEPSDRRAEFLSRLCYVHTSEFEVRQAHQSLDSAIECGKQAKIECGPTNDALRGEINYHLGCALSLRAQSSESDQDDLDDSISCAREALRLVKPEEHLRQGVKHNLIVRLLMRCQRDRTSNKHDLQEAVELIEEQEEKFPQDSIEYAQIVVQQSQVAYQNYLQNSETEDLDKTISLCQKAMSIFLSQSVSPTGLLKRTSTLLIHRYKKTNEVTDLDCAMKYTSSWLTAVPRRSGARIDAIKHHLILLREVCFTELLQDVTDVLTEARGLLAEIPKGHAERYNAYSCIGDILATCYIKSQEVDTLEQTVNHVICMLYEFRAEGGKDKIWQHVTDLQQFHHFLKGLDKENTNNDKAESIRKQLHHSFKQGNDHDGLLESISSISKVYNDFDFSASSIGDRISMEHVSSMSKQVKSERSARKRHGRLPPIRGMRRFNSVVLEQRLSYIRDAIFYDVFGYNAVVVAPKAYEELRALEARLEVEAFERERNEGSNPSPDLCRVCRKLKLLVVESEDKVTWTKSSPELFGTYDMIRARSGCAICRLIVPLLSDTENSGLHPRLARIHSDMQGVSIRPRKSSKGDIQLEVAYGAIRVGSLRVRLSDGFDGLDDNRSQELLSADSVTPNQGSRFTAEGWSCEVMRVSTLKRLLLNCYHNHERICEHAVYTDSRAKEKTPFILVDVLDECLTYATTKQRYYALSYVWGKVAIPLTRKLNLQERFEKGHLGTLRLPQTIESAMFLVRSLGERYLWTDALCIVQDDHKQKHHSIQNMDMIFDGAFCTIAVAHGKDAGAGLPGFFMPRPSMVISYDVRLTDQRDDNPPKAVTVTVTRSAPPLEHCLKESIWDKRGWVLQEQVLSRRIIYITSAYAYFQCTEGIWCEIDALEAGTGDPARDVPPAIALATENNLHHPLFRLKNMRPVFGPTYLKQVFDVYSQLVESYTERQLTYQSDVLDAFTGVLSVIDLYFQSDNVKGLPASALDLALLWTPAKPLARRKRSENSRSKLEHATESITYPSWSWIGWQGPVEYLAPLMHNALGTELPTPMIENVRFHHKGCIRDIELRKRAAFYGNRQRGTGPGSIEPVEDIGQIEPLSGRVQRAGSALLEFYAETVDTLHFNRSSSMKYYALREKSNVFAESQHGVAAIYDRAGNHCGIWHIVKELENEPDEQKMMTPSPAIDIAASTKPRHRLKTRPRSGSLPGEDDIAEARTRRQKQSRREFVAISRYDSAIVEAEIMSGHSSIEGELSMYDESVFPETGPDSGLVNVLLVEWKAEVAERVVVAQIHAQAWKQAQPKRKLIRLV